MRNEKFSYSCLKIITRGGKLTMTEIKTYNNSAAKTHEKPEKRGGKHGEEGSNLNSIPQ